MGLHSTNGFTKTETIFILLQLLRIYFFDEMYFEAIILRQVNNFKSSMFKKTFSERKTPVL